MVESSERGRVPQPLHPHCLASVRYSPVETSPSKLRDDNCAGLFKSAQWSADGTTIVANTEDNALRTFILPPDLLTSTHPKTIKPYATNPHPEPIYAHTLYPAFSLSDTSTTLALSSTRDHPIRLTNVLASPTPTSNPTLATYPLIHPPTETYLTPHSLLFTTAGTHFLAGSLSQLSAFDLSRPGSGPVETYPTIPSRRTKLVGGGVGFKGIVSALALSGERVVAAGSYGRGVGLYAGEGRAGCVGVFSVAGGVEDDGTAAQAYTGAGITSLHWSPCSRYLYVAERMSDGILVYDIRGTGQRVGVLEGRRGMTQQRLGVEVVPTAGGTGHEVWAGGTDGVVRVWSDPHECEGAVAPTEEWTAHNDAVSATLVHPSGTVAATCSGSRRLPDLGLERDSDSDSDGATSLSSASSPSPSSPSSGSVFVQPPPDYSLKIWSLV